MSLSMFNIIFNDAPQPWQIGFQDSAAPGFTGIIELHNTIFFYLVVIFVGVFWVLCSIIYYYNSKKSPIVHKYLNHGKCVPAQKSFKLMSLYNFRFYSTSNINSIKHYEDAFSMRKLIIKDNNKKSVEAVLWYIYNIASNMNKLPAKVYKNNKKAALYLLLLPPQIIIIKNKGIKTDSKKM